MRPLVTHTFVADTLTPVRAYAALRRGAGDTASFLLESVVAGERWGRYSILGYRPRYESVLLPSGTWVVTGEPHGMVDHSVVDPLSAAAGLFAPSERGLPAEANPAQRLARAQIGYLAWDLVHAVENVPGWRGLVTSPLARFVGGATVVVFDNLHQTVTVASEDQADVDRALADLERLDGLKPIPVPDRRRHLGNIDVDLDDARFEHSVRRALEYFAAGDAFLIVLARTFSTPTGDIDPFDIYRSLRVLNPSPYMYFLDLPPAPGETSRTQIAGASPETMVRLDGGIMTLRPIAGTRPRGRSEEEDSAFERDLLSDPKECAEHVMLIDLGRNDVGRVSEIGSVELVRRMEIERYSHVMHIVSEVRGRVPSTTPPLEVVRASFPAGTLSGAPKVRAMQIIRELEARPRGIYGGAIGYVAKTGDLDFAIAIRTAICRDGRLEVTAGAGIVEGSIPRSEADETRNKAGGVLCGLDSLRR